MKYSPFFGLVSLLGAAVLTIGADLPSRQRIRAASDSGTIRVHLLGHAIGSERYVIRPEGDAFVLTDTFAFTDRGGRIQLASEVRYSRSFEAIHLHSVGRTYRFVNVNADKAKCTLIAASRV